MKNWTLSSIFRSLVLVVVVFSTLSSLHAADRRPNFLFLYTDDHRWDAVGAVQKEQGKQARFPWFQSPNMDRLAADGVRFRNAFVTLSLCAPSRAAFLTGRYNHVNGIINNSKPFPNDAVTHATLLREAGYKTAYIGKWHMGNQRGQRPGFDYSASFVGQGQYQNCPFEINGEATPTKGWIDDVSTDFAIKWMKENRDQPFSMVLGFKSPHSPRGGNNLPERLRKLYADETSRPTPNCGVPAIFHKSDPKTGKNPIGLADNAVHLDYLRHIAGVDENIGRLLDALAELELADDTVVVYTSDNGYYLGEHNSGDKRSLYEESLRIPMLVRYPRRFGKGRVVDEMVINIDLAPTFLDLAGVKVPKEMQGASWKDLAEGRKPATWRASFLAEYYKELGDVPTSYALRTATHKLVKYPEHPEWTEVFDLTADPYEIKNLATDAALTGKLETELTRLMKGVDYTEPKGTGKPPEPAPPAKKPNIVYILADDLGYGDAGCYNPASKIPTPNIDRLAKEGVRFTDAHSPSAVCTPTRYALLTGRYAWRTRLQRNVIGPFAPPLIAEKQLTVAELLRDQGYATACIGKWHLGWGWPKPGDDGKRDFSKPIPDGPTTRGFDLYFGTDVPNYPPYCFLENDRTVGLPTEAAPVGRDSFNLAGPMVLDWKLVEVLPGLEKRAVEHIEKAAKGDKPFFLYLPLTSPHYPVVPSKAFEGTSKAGAFGDFVVQTDAVVGKVLEALKASGVAEKTLVIFTSDNGPEISGEVKNGAYDRLKEFGHASMGTLRGTKRDAWEGGHRVPFLARWPGKIQAGSVCEETVCHVDLMATLAAMLDVKLPADAGVDSVNILPALLGEKRKGPLREATVHHSGQGKFAIRRGDWVLILAPTGDDNGKKGEPAWFRKERGYEPHTEAGELFDLATDPTQKNNVYATETAKVKELTALLERYVTEGRSTPGPKQKNDVDITWDKRLGP